MRYEPEGAGRGEAHRPEAEKRAREQEDPMEDPACQVDAYPAHGIAHGRGEEHGRPQVGEARSGE